MPNRKNKYKDKQKYRETCYKQKRRYYAKTAKYERRPWTDEEDLLVLEHEITDTELSNQIRRSVGAIQSRRWKLKKQEK